MKRQACLLVLLLVAVLTAEVAAATPEAASRIFRARMAALRRNRRVDDVRNVAWRMAEASLSQHESNFLSVPTAAPDRHPIAHLTNHLANNNRRIPVVGTNGKTAASPPLDFSDVGNYHSEHGNKGRGHLSHKQLSNAIQQVVHDLWNATSSSHSHLERAQQTAVQLYRWFDVEGHALGRGRVATDSFWFDIIHEETGVDIVNTIARQRLTATDKPYLRPSLFGKRPSKHPSGDLVGPLGLLPAHCFAMPSADACLSASALRHHRRLVSAVGDQWAVRITPVRPGSPLGPPIKVFTKEEGADVITSFFPAVFDQFGAEGDNNGGQVANSSSYNRLVLSMECGEPALSFPLLFGATPNPNALPCVKNKSTSEAYEGLWRSPLLGAWLSEIRFPWHATISPSPSKTPIDKADYTARNLPWLRSPFTERINGDELRNRHLPIEASDVSPKLEVRKPRILCATYTFHKKVKKAATMHMFWGHECDTHILFTDKQIEPNVFEITFGISRNRNDKEKLTNHQRGGVPFQYGRLRAVVGIPKYGENYMNMWQKTRMILARVEEFVRGTRSVKPVQEESVAPIYFPQFGTKDPPVRFANASAVIRENTPDLFMDFDYILLGGDDVCFSPDAFRVLAGHLEREMGVAVGGYRPGSYPHVASTVPLHIGYAHRHFIAGAAYVMNNLAFNAYMQSGYPVYEPNGKTFAEDVLIGTAHTTVGTVPRNANSPSGSGEDIFACATQAYPSGMAMNVDSTNWMREYKRRVMPRGATCIGRDVVQTHFCSPVEMGNMKSAVHLIPEA